MNADGSAITQLTTTGYAEYSRLVTGWDEDRLHG